MRHDARGLTGGALALAVVLLALVGPLVAPHDPGAFVGRPFQSPDSAHPLGLDVLGRDVLSSLLSGGLLFLAEAVAATIIGVGLGVLAGTVLATLPRKPADIALSFNDALIVLPQIIIALLVLTRLGSSPFTLIAVIAFAHVPQSARVVRVAVQRVTSEGYFEAARGFGARWGWLFWREIMPNITGVVVIELSIRLAISSVVLATLSYLGFGATADDWGSMIHQNQGGLTIQPLAVLAPVAALGCFLVGANLFRDGLSRALAKGA
ncbi:ABC transporter permease [Ruicaihuangia caeni]|uniref:ABC transporter permease subunit n=1 Tax=Ruicaihuangia caeni TaxID=3042517 RepID=A0AAW6T7P0_9MICO|nr:ABC transporter permease subunit [Klugiella sp. YN-L-19]MDI2098726.1 ABC transporter permease subunit [Klugiella sp. YN-L-19]